MKRITIEVPDEVEQIAVGLVTSDYAIEEIVGVNTWNNPFITWTGTMWEDADPMTPEYFVRLYSWIEKTVDSMPEEEAHLCWVAMAEWLRKYEEAKEV